MNAMIPTEYNSSAAVRAITSDKASRCSILHSR
jgi:hypothetical protein